jgi:hypothetical protein
MLQNTSLTTPAALSEKAVRAASACLAIVSEAGAARAASFLADCGPGPAMVRFSIGAWSNGPRRGMVY